MNNLEDKSGRALRFPTVGGSDLNGRSVTLPRDFPGPASLLFVAFERKQQDDVDSWRPFVVKLKQGNPSLGVFELPTIGRAYLLMRFIIDNSMRSGIQDAAMRASTVTLYLKVKQFTRAIGVSTTRRIAVFVVKPSGEILAQTFGPFSDTRALEISKGLEAARQSTPSFDRRDLGVNSN